MKGGGQMLSILIDLFEHHNTQNSHNMKDRNENISISLDKL